MFTGVARTLDLSSCPHFLGLTALSCILLVDPIVAAVPVASPSLWPVVSLSRRATVEADLSGSLVLGQARGSLSPSSPCARSSFHQTFHPCISSSPGCLVLAFLCFAAMSLSFLSLLFGPPAFLRSPWSVVLPDLIASHPLRDLLEATPWVT